MSEAALTGPPPEAAARSFAWRGGLLRLAGPTLILAGALAVRLVEFRDIPRLTDETDEVVRALSIAHGEMLPLTNVDAYIGPLWNYVLALAFLVAGPSSLLPRSLTLLVGLATVGMSVWLGRELARQTTSVRMAQVVGLGAGLLLAASSFHAIVSSRIAWSHSLTPLMMTVALGCLLRWDRAQEGRWLALGGLAYGLAVHTHLTALAFGPGIGVWALLRWRAIVSRRDGLVGLGLFLLALLPLLVYNVTSGFGSASAAVQVRNAYAAGQTTSTGGYLGNLLALLHSLPLLLAGEIGERRGVMVALEGPVEALYSLLALVGLGAAVWRRSPLPLLALLSAAAVFPIVNGKYEPLFNGRYLAPLLPLGIALVALGVVTLTELLGRFRVSLALRVVLPSALLVALTGPPLISLRGYIDAARRDGPNNAELYRAARIVEENPGVKPILVESTLSGTRQSTGREGVGVLEYLLIVDGDLTVRRLQPNDLERVVDRRDADLVIVSPRLALRLSKDFELRMPPGEEEARRRRRAGFLIFRVMNPG